MFNLFFNKNFIKKIVVFSLFIANSSCIYPKVTIKSKDIKLLQVEFKDFKNWENNDYRMSLISFLNSCKKFANMPQNRAIGGKIGNMTPADFRDVCEIGEIVIGLKDEQIKNYFENWFRPFLVIDKNGNENGLFTGYYEASLEASKTMDHEYKFPIYSKPNDLDKEPYLTRLEIENGALKNKNLEILYAKDDVELFFTHIQGSAKIKLKDGGFSRLAYSAKNNHNFKPISEYLLQKQYLQKSEISAQNIKNWLKSNPEMAQEVMNYNNSYVFFRLSKDDYAIGAQGVELTSEKSLAVDSEFIPYGLPIWLETKLKGNDYCGLFVSQDTGSAIKGIIRGDIFFGNGKIAEDKASSMSSKGRYFVLLPADLVQKMTKNREIF